MLAHSVGRFVDTEYDFESRQKFAASDGGFSREMWATFAELGVTTVPFAEEDGGLGLKDVNLDDLSPASKKQKMGGKQVAV